MIWHEMHYVGFASEKWVLIEICCVQRTFHLFLSGMAVRLFEGTRLIHLLFVDPWQFLWGDVSDS